MLPGELEDFTSVFGENSFTHLVKRDRACPATAAHGTTNVTKMLVPKLKTSIPIARPKQYLGATTEHAAFSHCNNRSEEPMDSK